jgi:hypothetical protein
MDPCMILTGDALMQLSLIQAIEILTFSISMRFVVDVLTIAKTIKLKDLANREIILDSSRMC